MNIYTKNQNEMKKIVISFIRTTYGKIMFILSYAMFFIFLVQGLMVLALDKSNLIFFAFVFLALISFVLGSINYYKELRVYAQERK